ncbi:glycosyltransferase family 10 domain-containing protein [Arenibacterium sp. CAU 1754]
MTDQDPAIAILPYGTPQNVTLAARSTEDLIWPLGCPARLKGATVGDMGAADHLIVYPKTISHFSPRRGLRAQISLILGEPSIIHTKHLNLLRVTHRRFFRVLTFNETLLGRIPNGIFFPFGSTWVPEWRDLPLNKTEMTSLIASAKRDTTGHKLRHSVVDWIRQTGQQVEVMGRGYTPFERKADGLAPFRYSVVIENMREPNYFSEKLVDAVLCSTVPIYWGCPNLDRFVDPDGIIQCASLEDIQRAVQSVSERDFEERLPKIQAMQPVLDSFGDIDKRAAQAIRDSL